MKITAKEFNKIVDSADKIKTADHSKSKTRHGSYISVQKGLSFMILFFGFDTSKESFEFIYEIVG